METGNIAPGYFQAYASIKNVLLGYEDEIDPGLISKIPYASMTVRIGKGPLALLILESVNEDEYTWVSSDGVFLVFKQGRIVKTQGLPNNLHKLISSSTDFQEAAASNTEYISYISFRNPELNNLKVSSKFRINELSKEKLTFGTKNLLHVTEKISSVKIGWEEENSFWVDENNFVWKSIQHISPRLPPIYIEVTKKPR